MANLGWMAIGAAVIALLVQCMILCARDTAKKMPINYFLLILFTACQSLVLSYLATNQTLESSITMIGISTIVLIALTLYSIYASHDLSFMRVLVFFMTVSGSSAAAFSSCFSFE